MNHVRQTANKRSEFAREQYDKYIRKVNITKTGILIDTIAGYNARKLAQAYNIYVYYLNVFNGSKPRGMALYSDTRKQKKKNNFIKS